MAKMTKKQMKDNARIMAWINGEEFQENSRAKPAVPDLHILDVLEDYTPENQAWGAKFYTPLKTAQGLMADAGLDPHSTVLEPCAGIGHLIFEMVDTFRVDPGNITAYELDEQAYKVGSHLFPQVQWTNGDPFSDLSIDPDGSAWGEDKITGMFDFVVMNPPFNCNWGTAVGDYMTQGKCKKSEHLFLELAVRAVKPGGKILAIAPYSYLEKMPKKLRAWFDRYTDGFDDRGELDADFKGTAIKVNGFIIYRNNEPMEPFPTRADAIAEEWANAPEGALQEAAYVHTTQREPEPAAQQPQVVSKATTGDNPTQHRGTPEKTAENKPTLLTLFEDETKDWVFEGEMSTATILSKIHPKQVFYKKQDRGLVGDIQRHGVIHPIILQEMGEYYWVRAGTRRLRACQELGIGMAPVRIFVSTSGTGALIALGTNIHQSSNPLDEYRSLLEVEAYATAQGVFYTDRELCDLLGITIQKLRKYRKISILPDAVQTAITEERITIDNANRLVKLPPSDQSDLVSQLSDGERVTESDIRKKRMVQREAEGAKLQNLLPPPPVDDRPDLPSLTSIENALFAKFGLSERRLADWVHDLLLNPDEAIREALGK